MSAFTPTFFAKKKSKAEVNERCWLTEKPQNGLNITNEILEDIIVMPWSMGYLIEGGALSR